MPALRIATVLALVFLFCASAVQSAPLSRIDSSAWQHDLDYLASNLVRYHVNAFHDVSRNEFNRRVADLRREIPQLDRAKTIVGIARIIALVHDAHTGFGLGTAPPVSFHSLPIKVYEYADGVFIQAAEPAYADIVGKRVVKVGGVPISEVLRRLGPIASVTNDWTFRSQLQFLFKGEILYALGLSQHPQKSTITVETSEGEKNVSMATMQQPFSMGYKPGPPEGSNWVDSRIRAGSTPLFLSNLTKFYWYKWLPDSRTFYVQCNFILNADSQSFTDFFSQVFALTDTLPVDKFVLDLRYNGGGDNFLLPVVVQNIIKRDRLNAAGKLFVIIGRGTQSAAENLVNRLQRDTRATFVGEPTGEKPNEYGDPWPFVLPNSGIEAHIASIQWEDIDPRDDRQWTGPDLAAELSSSDYASGIDPAMDAIQNLRFTPIDVALQPAITSGSVDQLRTAYKAYLDDPVHRFTQTQYKVEEMGSGMLDSKSYALAQNLLSWNAAQSPNSARALDASCDSYLPTRQIRKAKECYLQVLRLFPRDSIAGSRLSELAAAKAPHT